MFDGRKEAGDPATYYDRQLRTESESAGGSRFKRGTQKGRRGSFELAREAWEDLDLGISWSDTPASVKTAFQTKINYAAFALRNQGDNEQDIQELAVQLADEIKVVVGQDGLTVTDRKLPRGLPNATPEAQVRFEQTVQALTENDAEGATYGKPIYDRQSSVDGSYLISRDGAPSVAPSGQVVYLPEGDDPALAIVEVIDTSTPGVVKAKVRGPGEDIPVVGGAYYHYSEERGAWELRGRDLPPAPEDNSISTEDLEYRRQQRMLAEEQAADVDGMYAMIGEGTDAPVLSPARKTQAEAAERIVRKQSYDAVSGGVASGAIGPMGAKRARAALSEEEIVSAEKSAQIVQKARSEVINELGDRPGLISGVTNHVANWEEFRAQAYDDGSSRSVGYGFWLGNKDAKERVEALGYSYNDLKRGTELMTEEDARFLMEQDIQRSLNYVRKKLSSWGREVSELDNHQIQALIDLHYNGGPAMFGPGLKRSFQATHWRQAVADEIKHRSNASGSKGLQARRNSQAGLFLGYGKLDPRS